MRAYSKQLNDFLGMVKRQDFIVLDTETTGLHAGEIVQIAIVDHTGGVLLDTLVKPTSGIPADATRIHGITEAMVSDCLGWDEIAFKVMDVIKGKDLIVYNATYDRKMMHQSDEHYSTEKVNWRDLARWYCAMENYAEFYGDWNDYHGSYRWQRLTAAMFQQNLPTQDAHTALGDCLMTLALVKKMAEI